MRKLLYLCLLCLCSTHVALAADEEQKPKPVPQYFELPKSLVTNLTGGPKYIRADVQFMFYEEDGVDNKELLSKHAPALRHEMLLMLIDQDGTALKTLEGKKRLRKAALKSLRRIMMEKTGHPVIEDLFFTSYYVR